MVVRRHPLWRETLLCPLLKFTLINCGSGNGALTRQLSRAATEAAVNQGARQRLEGWDACHECRAAQQRRYHVSVIIR